MVVQGLLESAGIDSDRKSIDAPHYDAQRTTWGPTSDIVNMFQDTLVALDWDLKSVHPLLAKSWKVSEDGKTYTFELKPGLKFASGNPLSAEDVVFSLSRAVKLNKTPAFILNQFGLTKETVDQKVRATGPMEVTMTIDKAFAPSMVRRLFTHAARWLA